MYTLTMSIQSIEKTEKIINSVFKQAKNGTVSIESDDLGNWSFYVKFFTKIAGVLDPNFDGNSPVVNIPKFKKFVELTDNYLNVAKQFYKDDQNFFSLSDKGFEEKLFMDLFVNATNFDINNIEQFLTSRTKMVKQNIKTGSFDNGEYQGYVCTCLISKNHSNLEGTHKFSIKFSSKDGEEFLMPAITFSKVDDIVYVFAIQRPTNQSLEESKSTIEKKLDRFFRKVNKDVPEELQNISPNALVSFTIFCNCLKSNKIKDIIAPNFMPIRYDAKKSSIEKNAKTIEDEQKKLEKHDKNQYNITNKFMDLLVRYNYHFKNSEINYDSNTEMMVMQLSENEIDFNADNIIYDISNLGKEKTQNIQKIEEKSL